MRCFEPAVGGATGASAGRGPGHLALDGGEPVQRPALDRPGGTSSHRRWVSTRAPSLMNVCSSTPGPGPEPADAGQHQAVGGAQQGVLAREGARASPPDAPARSRRRVPRNPRTRPRCGASPLAVAELLERLHLVLVRCGRPVLRGDVDVSRLQVGPSPPGSRRHGALPPRGDSAVPGENARRTCGRRTPVSPDLPSTDLVEPVDRLLELRHQVGHHGRDRTHLVHPADDLARPASR